MLENKEGLYAAFQAKDKRLDGRMFVGISSTGIYCRPVCRAKQPKIENCNFFVTAAEAERAGYRPCLICRPELAPGISVTDSSTDLAEKAARLLEDQCGSGKKLSEFTNLLGCSERHLRRVFLSEYHVTPIRYLQTCRLLLAKNLLTDTSLTVTEIAMASGFGSLRRLNELFKGRYQLSPTALRRKASKDEGGSGSFTVKMGYRPPYLWEKMMSFLALRAIPGVEIVKAHKYYRTVHLKLEHQKDVYGWLCVSNDIQKALLAVTLSESLIPALPQVLAKVKLLFDCYCDPIPIYEALASMNCIRQGLSVPGTRLPGCFDDFEMAVRAVLGQQITVKAAGTLAGRLVKRYGTPVDTGIDRLTHTFPSSEAVAAIEKPIESHLGPLGITAARSRTIYELARGLSSGEIRFGLYAQPERVMEKLQEIPGIGSWTARYIAMRAMGYTDAFLETDIGVKKALPDYTPKEAAELMKAYRPWRSYAVINLWNSISQEKK